MRVPTFVMDESLNSERDYIGLSFMVLTFVRAWDELVVGVRFICWIGEILVKASRKVRVKGVRDCEIRTYISVYDIHRGAMYRYT